MNSKPPHCTQINADHIPNVEEIHPDILLLNDFNGKIIIDDQPLELQGTFVIKYHNTSIKVKEKYFKIHEISNVQPLPAVLQLKDSSKPFEEILLLERIKGLEEKNTKELETMKIIGLTSISGLTIKIILLLGLSIAFIRKKNQYPKILRKRFEENSQSRTFALKERGVNTTHAQIISKNANDSIKDEAVVFPSPNETTNEADKDLITNNSKEGTLKTTSTKRLAFPWETQTQHLSQ